jgi:hypothetical protein
VIAPSRWKQFPRLLAIPPLFIKMIRDQNKSLMPHKVWAFVKAYSGSPGLPQEVATACKFAFDWCLVAAQASGADKDSHVAFGLNAVMDQEHVTSLARWLDQWINTMLEHWLELAGSQAQVGAVISCSGGHLVDADIITRAVGQGLALGYQHQLQQRGDSMPAQGDGSTSKISNLGFSANDVAMNMSYSGIEHREDCQNIWTIFADNKKNIESCRWYLMKGIQNYGYRLRIGIDNGLYLEQNTMKSILDLHFNPGEGVAHLQSAAKGLSILCCRAWGSHKMEKIKERELALNTTKQKQMFDDYLKYVKGATRHPTSSYWDLKLNIATFMALVWVLFSDKCGIQWNLYKIYTVMYMQEVQQLKGKFTPKICHRITWAILDDGRAFFNMVLTPQDFERGVLAFPQSYLSSILETVRFCNPIQQGKVPSDWLQQPKVDRT